MSCSTDTLKIRLHRAARDGDTSALRQLLLEDPLLLQRITGAASESPAEDAPLHIASLLGHVQFVAVLVEEHPQLGAMRDDRGSYPLHLAAAKGHVQVVKVLMAYDKDLRLCRLLDKQQRTPLHCAAASGKVEVLKQLILVSHVDKETAHARTDRGETTLHLAVKCNQIEAAKFLVDYDKGLVNMKDDQGNTVLHLATAQKHMQMLKLFLEIDGVDVKAENEHGFTALDVLVHGPSERGDVEIGEMLRNAGCERAATNKRSKMSKRRREASMQQQRSLLRLLCLWYKRNEKNEKQLKNMHNTLLIVATLIATVTFTAGLGPPGGIWSEPPPPPAAAAAPPPSPTSTTSAANYTPGKAIQAKPELTDYSAFLISNTVGLVASCSIILLLVSGLPLKNHFMTLILIIIMWVAILSLMISFAVGARLVSSSDPAAGILFHAVRVWMCLMAIILVFHLIRAVLRILKCLYPLVCKLFRLFRTRKGDNPTDIETGQGHGQGHGCCC
ncbi:hypothetical protein ACLOJK_021161 [Asimina triloba]